MEHQLLIIIEKSLQNSSVTKATAALSMLLGSKEFGIATPDVIDSEGNSHSGKVLIEYPIIQTTHEDICLILESARKYDGEIDIFDLNTFACKAKTNDEYVDMMQTSPASDIRYKGIALYGDKEVVRKAVKGILK